MERLLRQRKPGDEVYAVTAGPKTTKEEKQPTASEVPANYAKFLDVFKDQKELKTLPKRQPWDHKIELVEDAHLEDRLPVKVRPTTREEREELKEQLKLNL
jgi:hypothetical protein